MPCAAEDPSVGGPVVSGTRCAHCSAALRSGAPWCTQCYAPVGAAEPAPVGPATGAAAPRRTAEPRPPSTVPAGPAGPAGPSWPCDVCGHDNGLAADRCATCGTAFLAAVRSAAPALVLPLVGDVASMSVAGRAGAAVALAVALLVVTAALGLLLA